MMYNWYRSLVLVVILGYQGVIEPIDVTLIHCTLTSFQSMDFLLFFQANWMGTVCFPSRLRSQAGDQSTNTHLMVTAQLSRTRQSKTLPVLSGQPDETHDYNNWSNSAAISLVQNYAKCSRV